MRALSLVLISISACVAANRALSVEGGGPGGFYSVNYEQVVGSPLPYLSLSGRAGVSFSSGALLDIPIGVLGVVGTKTHRIELGVVVTPEVFFEDYGTLYSFLVFPMVAWRVHPHNGPLFLRVAATPAWEPFKKRIFGWGGAGIGYGF